MWTREEFKTIGALTVCLVKKDGVAKFYTVVPRAGYLVRVPALDTQVECEDGTVQTVPYLSRGGGTEILSYDWETNPKGYTAVAETEGAVVC